MDVGDEALDAVGDELDRTLEQLRKRDRRHLVGIGMDLDAERAADVLGQDADLMLLESEVLGEQVLHHVRSLGALIDGEPLVARVPIGDDGARLVGDPGVTPEHERRLHHRIGVLEALVGVAGDEHALEGEIVAKFGMDDRRAGVERGLGIGDRRQFLVADIHQLAAILRFGPRARDHRAYRLALPARALDRDCMLRRRFDALEVGENADPGRDDLRQFSAGDHRDDARRRLRRGRRDRRDARVGVGRADEGHVRHARQRHITHELGATTGEPREIGPRHRSADIGVRPVEGREGRGRVVGDFHRVPCEECRAFATASTASTIA